MRRKGGGASLRPTVLLVLIDRRMAPYESNPQFPSPSIRSMPSEPHIRRPRCHNRCAHRRVPAPHAEELVREQLVRADALAGLVKNAGEYSALLNKLALPKQSDILRNEAKRIVRRNWLDESEARPQPHDIAAWNQLVGEEGDVDAGRRVFLRTTCANCHAHSGRGSRVGPDLTRLAGQMSRERLLESILLPSREMGPLYVPWRVLTVDGKVLSGMRLEKSGASDKMSFLGAEGQAFEVPLVDIEAVEPSPQSIMPEGLVGNMSLDEFRDLLAFLLAP